MTKPQVNAVPCRVLSSSPRAYVVHALLRHLDDVRWRGHLWSRGSSESVDSGSPILAGQQTFERLTRQLRDSYTLALPWRVARASVLGP
jgi:hypothetical protein